MEDINPARKKLKVKSKKKEKKIDNLVLWDMENIHFYDDFSIINRYVKSDNQRKTVSYAKKFISYIGKDQLSFKLNRLKKRNWIIRDTKKIADNELIMEFYKYKDRLTKLIIISNDSDFKKILLEAQSLDIEVTVLHRNCKNQNLSWYDLADHVKDIREI